MTTTSTMLPNNPVSRIMPGLPLPESASSETETGRRQDGPAPVGYADMSALQPHTLTRGRGDMVQRRSRRGFSLLELLVAVAIIAVLVSLVTVVGGRLRRAAEKTNTQRLMNDIKIGLVQFNSDFGFYPPLLDDDLELPDGADEKEDMGFYSTLTLVPYLVGRGDLNLNGDEGLNDNYDDGAGGLGFRNPGPDLSWGGSNGAGNRETYLQQVEASQGGALRGRVYGPYIELGDDFTFDEARRRDGSTFNDSALFVFNDAWDEPIRYYRDWDQVANPGEMPYPREWIATQVADAPVEDGWIAGFPPDDLGGAMIALRSAPFVLMSEGPDNESDDNGNEDLVNNDNLMLIGD